MDDVIQYIDLKSLGKDLLNQRNGKLTEYGILCRIDEGMENSQEEEEFE